MNEMITTIIPTFRRPALLKKAILSVLSQSYPHFQVCVYDNASGDETEEIVKQLMKQDPRVKYYRHRENIGMMANYKFAVSRIDTPYFSLLSDDDFLLPTFFETALDGFKKFPNVAFSACAVKAVDEKEQFVSDPMSVWDREGYFDAREGIFEMIEKPLLPVGILFNYQLVKNVEIDSSETIQIRWDTDYLLQISSQFPFVTNKCISAIFLSHAQGFSTGCYREMPRSTHKFDRHIQATERMMERLLSALAPFPETKAAAKKAFFDELERNINWVVGSGIQRKLFSEAWRLIFMYRSRFGMSKVVLKLALKVFVFQYAPWAVPYIQSLMHACSKKSKFRNVSQGNSSEINR